MVAYKLCDVLIEAIKPFFAGSDPRFETDRSFAQDTLWLCLENGLQLLHHFMSYVMEELWKHLPSSRDWRNKRALGALILTVPFPTDVGLALHKFYIKNFPYRAPKTLHVHAYLKYVWAQAPATSGFLMFSTPQLGVDRVEGESGVAT